MSNAQSGRAPGAIPRECYASYRGNLAAKPRKIDQGQRAFVAARIGVNMATPDVPAEEKEKLTE